MKTVITFEYRQFEYRESIPPSKRRSYKRVSGHLESDDNRCKVTGGIR